MSLFRAIDDFLFDEVFEKFCHWSQRTIGKTHEFWTKSSLALYLVFLVLIINYRILNDLSYSVEMFVFVTISICFLSLDYDDRKKNSAENTMNSLRNTGYFIRILFLYLFAFDLLKFLMTLSVANTLDIFLSIAFFAYCYFSACTDLPKSKTRNRLSEMFLVRNEARAKM